MQWFRLLLAMSLLPPGAVAQEIAWPNEAPDDWLLAFVDVETTGLKPGFHEMIDIGVVITDLRGNLQGDFFTRIQPEHPERTDEGARAINAFDPKRWQELGAVDKDTAVKQLLLFHEDVARDKNVLMVAFNSHFDASFLDQLFRSQGQSWRTLYHYFILDLPSMAWAQGVTSLTGTSIAAALGVEDEPHIAELHTGITGAKLNAGRADPRGPAPLTQAAARRHCASSR